MKPPHLQYVAQRNDKGISFIRSLEIPEKKEIHLGYRREYGRRQTVTTLTAELTICLG